MTSTTPGTALVTGGSRGIGAAIALRLAADGYSVAVGYASRAEAADAVVDRIVSAGGSAVGVQGDLRDTAAACRLITQARQLGPLVVLVNNAGITGPVGRYDEKDDDELRSLVDVNLVGPMLTCREAVRAMSTKYGGAGGSIINIASVAARTGGLPGLVAYAATKGALVTFSRGLSTEVAGEGIRVNSISPGTIETELTTDEFRRAGLAAPIRRIGQPSDIAGAVSWLVSPDAAFVTGTDITVSGGR